MIDDTYLEILKKKLDDAGWTNENIQEIKKFCEAMKIQMDEQERQLNELHEDIKKLRITFLEYERRKS